MASMKKKPSLADAMAESVDATPDSEGSGDYDAASDELADVLGVPDDKRDAFREALEAAVMSCR